jgi:hypothetical protein
MLLLLLLQPLSWFRNARECSALAVTLRNTMMPVDVESFLKTTLGSDMPQIQRFKRLLCGVREWLPIALL